LEVLLNGGVVLLRRRGIAGFQIGGQLVEGLDDGIRALRGCSRISLRPGLLQRGKIRLRRGKIDGLQILAELLELLLKLLHPALYALRVVCGKTTAENACYRHADFLLSGTMPPELVGTLEAKL